MNRRIASVVISNKINPADKIYGVNLINRSIRSALAAGFTHVVLSPNLSRITEKRFRNIVLTEAEHATPWQADTIFNNVLLKKGEYEKAIIGTIEKEEDLVSIAKTLSLQSRKCLGSGIDRYWFDWPGTQLAKLISPLSISPNFITVLSFIFAVLGARTMSNGNHANIFIGAIIIHIGYLFDCIDGRLARLKGLQSDLGSFLDSTFDVVSQFVWHVGIIVAVLNYYNSTFVIIGVIALTGDAIFMTISHIVNSHKSKDSDKIQQIHNTKKNTLVSSAIHLFDFVSNNDIRLYAILIASLLNRLDFLVIFMAIVLNAKWVAILVAGIKNVSKHEKTFISKTQNNQTNTL